MPRNGIECKQRSKESNTNARKRKESQDINREQQHAKECTCRNIIKNRQRHADQGASKRCTHTKEAHRNVKANKEGRHHDKTYNEMERMQQTHA